MNTLLGTKKKMGQSFVGDKRLSVTYIEAGPCVVTQVKNLKKDGYWAVQLGHGKRSIKNISKPLRGHLKSAVDKKTAPSFLREVRFDKEPNFKVGDVVTVSDVFKKGDVIEVTGTSKGKGFAGVMKRWNFGGGPRTHGQSDRQRAPGSIGQGTDPGRVWKGKKMPGRMGGERVTVKNLLVVEVDPNKNELVVSGPVPGVFGGKLIVTKIGEGKLTDLIEEVQKVEVKEEEENGEEGEKKEIKEEKKIEEESKE